MGDQDVCFNHAGQCSICLSRLGQNDETSVLKCGHQYHATCIYRWLDRANTCPMCRTSVRERTIEVEHDPEIDNLWDTIIPNMIRGLVDDGVITVNDRIRVSLGVTLSDPTTGVDIISARIQ